MKYYILDYAFVTKEETGHVYPQILSDSPALQFEGANSVKKLEMGKFSDFIPNLNYYELDPEGRLTGMLTGGIPPGASGGVIKGIIVSENLKNTLQQYNLASYKMYPAVIKEKNTFHTNYYFMHIVSDLEEYIDYSKTIFFIKRFSRDLGPIEISSEKEYKEKNRQLEGSDIISTHKPVLRKDIIFQYDFFVEKYFTFKIYVSERLKTAMITKKITGVSFKEAVNIEIV